ncbi:sulfatase [Campylobacter sp. MIT 99-7217]|uniref:LTA synthase family protein n=1 Tax=Campylobacter sp. MIT 99-7217 TaxID=535091 RepID=UPI001159771B|nr:LTA synthase family protein [Campylobacter sp. MIT 99-7217]TQR33696.1 sulfatase [Campylobacter sp. MIT 99-7217]
MRKILLQILVFSLVFIALFALQRAFMIGFAQNELLNTKDLIKMSLAGAFHDIRLCASGFLPLLLIYFILLFLKPFETKIRYQSRIITHFYLYASSFYIGLFAFLNILFCFINYYYFALYQNKIDIFIFGLKDDDTSTLLKIIWSDYPILLLLFLALIFSLFCAWLNHKILRLDLKPLRLKFSFLILFNLGLIALYIIALRGPYKHVSMNAFNYKFHQIPLINEIAVNPILAFSWALKQYKNDEKINFISDEEGANLQKELFPLYQTSPKNELALRLKPHVVLNIMESFGLAALDFQNEVNLLGELEKHFEQDFLFTRFLSSENGTMPSFSRLLFLSPKAQIASSRYQNLRLKDTPLQIYKNAGYKLVFVYAGNEAWQNVGNFLKAQGVDEIIDEVVLMSEYEGAKESANGYGVADEYMYKKIYELLKNSEERLFIIALSISNHPPYNKTPYALLDEKAVPKALLERTYSPKTNNALEILQAFAYANNEFGKFLSLIKKDEKLASNTIIAATGDHRQRELKTDFNTQKALTYSVPFYLYIPKALQKDLYYDKTRIGSHKDIFATLYALSLSEVKFLSLGGKNMLAKPQNERLEFGFNSDLFITQKGIYLKDSKQGFFYRDKESLNDENKAFEADLYHQNFYENYQRLDEYQFSSRLKEALKE